MARQWQRLLPPLLFGLALAGGAAAYWGLDLPRHMRVEAMRALVESHAPYGPLIFIAMVVATIFTQVPMMGIVMIAVGGILFSGPAAFAYGWVASLAGTTSTFLIVRYIARARVQDLLYSRYARLRALDDRLARNGFWTVFVLRLVGVLAPPLNWGLGLTNVRIQDYVAGTALGLVPGIATIVYFADSIARHPLSSWHLSPVVILRAASLLAFGGPLLMGLDRARGEAGSAPGERRGSRLPLVANLAAFAVFFPLLIVAAGETTGSMPLLLSITGTAIAVTGAVVVRRSRAELGAAWSFVPRAGEQSGVVTSGPYRLVRHPIYLGLSMLAGGQGVAFSNGPALLVVCAAVIPSFVWRAKVEEHLLTQVFGARYREYRKRSKMIIPSLR